MARLDTLLAHVLVDFNDQVEAARRDDTDSPSLVQWANFLRVVPDDGLAPNDIAVAARVSRRAIKSRAGMQSHWIETGSITPRRPWWRLTKAGLEAREHGRQLIAAADEAWRQKLGVHKTSALKAAAARLVGRLELELSHYPMGYGPADGSVTGGRHVAAQAGPPRLPSHGADWKPVIRGKGDTVSELHLYALVSQAYVAFQIDYEQSGGATIAATEALARAFPTARVPLADLPENIGVDGSGRSALERHGVVRVEEDAGVKTAVLTASALARMAAHDTRLQTIAEDWRERYGTTAVDELQSSLEAVNAGLPTDLPDHCIVAWWHDISRLAARRGG